MRHGATTHTAARRLSGCTGDDPALSAAGREQVAALARALVREQPDRDGPDRDGPDRDGPDGDQPNGDGPHRDQAGRDQPERTVTAVISSPVRRARETAATLATALGLRVALDDDLREIDFGAWEGLTVEQVQDGWPDGLDSWRTGSHQPAPGGESVEDVARRAAAARARVATTHAGATVLVVSHLYPVRLCVLDALGAPLTSVHRLLHQPTAVSEVVIVGERSELVRHNDFAHLR